MKKAFFTLLLIATFSLTCTAQYYYIPPLINPPGNPGNLNNDLEEPYDNGLPSSWNIIDPQSAAPTWTAVQTLPFTFVFNGNSFNQYKVSNTGIVTFTTSATSVPGSSNTIIPDPSIPNNSIMIWGISYTGGPCNDRIVTKTFGTPGNRQHWIQFNSYNIPTGGAYCYTYSSIVLEEGTNHIHIVDQRCSNKYSCKPTVTVGVQINGSSAVMASGSPNLGSYAGTSKTTVDNRYFTFIQGTAPTRDLSVSWLQLTPFVILNTAPFDIKGKCQNYTGTAVTSYDINYQVDNGPVQTAHMTGAAYNIDPYGEEWFIHDSAWTPDSVGIYTMKIWADNINGGNDQNNANDTMEKVIEVSTAFIPKLTLFEEFTSSTNPACAPANSNLKSTLDYKQGNYTLIKYPMDYPGTGDPYHSIECDARKAYYGVDSLPDMIVNGTQIVDPLYIDTFQFNSLWDKAYMTFSPTHTIVGNKVSVSASILPFQNFNQSTLVVRFALVETQTTGNVGTNGETVFYNTFHKFIGGDAGVTLGPLQQAVFVTKSRNYTFPASNNIENWNNLKIVVFVQDEATGEVLQSAYSTKQSSIDDKSDHRSMISIAPNPTNGLTTLHYFMEATGPVTINIFNSHGRIVKQLSYTSKNQGLASEVIDVSNLSSGLYIIKLQNNNIINTAKLQIN